MAYYGMILVHGPHKTTPHNKEGKGTYKGQVEYLDHLVGRIVASLEELGLRDRTIVMFTTDNGSSQGARAWGAEQPKGKGKVAERGVHVPFIANCPGLVPSGRTTDRLIDLSDVLPTLAELAGAPLPEGVTLDGRSFASELLGREGGAKPREWIFSQVGNRRVVRDKRFTLYNDGRFYDVSADRGETSDLSSSTDPELAAARRRLTRILDSFPPDTPLPEFPPRYDEINKVPALPPGSGRWEPWTPKAKPKKEKRKRDR